MSDDKLENIAGSGIEITIKGKEYKLGTYGVKDLADFRQYIKGRRVKILQETITDSAERIELIDRVIQGNIDEMRELSNMDGVRFMLWRSLQKYQPEMTLEDADKLIDLDNMVEMANIVRNIGGKVKNPPKGAKKK